MKTHLKIHFVVLYVVIALLFINWIMYTRQDRELHAKFLIEMAETRNMYNDWLTLIPDMPYCVIGFHADRDYVVVVPKGDRLKLFNIVYFGEDEEKVLNGRTISIRAMDCARAMEKGQ